MAKAIALPITTMVILAVGIIVLLAVVAFFIGGFTEPAKDIQLRANFMRACDAWTAIGCEGNPDYNITNTCVEWRRADPSVCNNKNWLRSACGCPS